MAKFSSIFLSRVRRSASSTVVIAALTTLNPASLHAEGAFQMGLEQWMLDNQRAIDQGYATDDASASLFVDILSAGEVINVSLCGASTTDDITVEFYAPSNNTTPVSTQSLTDANMSCTDSMTAPLTNPMRYTTLETGAYRLVLQNTTNTDFADSVFTRYDITVTPDAATDPDPSEAGGRLWAYSYSFNARGFEEENSTDANYYAKVPGGRPNTEYIWQLDLNNFAGYGYNLSANSVGVDAPNSGYSTPTASNGASYLHKMYVSYPAQYDPRPTTPPTLSAVRFVDSAGQDYAISPGATSGIQDDGVFEFTTDVTGTYSVLIDLNQDGIYGNAGDRQLLGEAVIGLNQVPWDGRDAAGNAPALGVYYSQVQIHMGEYHFIANDAETSGGTEDGLTVHLANPDGTVEPTKVYWDDVTLMPAGGTSNTPNGAFSNTPEGKHTWGDFVSSSFGNNSFLDTYVYGLAEVSYAPTAVINDDTLQVNFDGTVTADPFSAPGNAVAISVSDEDLNTSASSIETVDVEVVNDITGEVETVTLTETGPNTGVFAATMPTTAGTTAGADNNGSMNTKPADTLTVSYIDLIAEDLTSKIPTAAVTVAFDTDGDGIPDSTDLDDDNDGIADAAEGAGDTDGDGIPNSLDTDSDNDGILDSEEDTTSPTLLGTDSDLDGIDDAVDASITGGPDTNSDGVDDTFAPTDTDGDDLPDHLDMDSDADGILDSYETTIDTDNDNTPDYLDLDSDGDGIPDAVEDTTTPALLGTDADADGIDDAIDVTQTGGTDANGNGIDDAIEPTDLDTDAAPNHLELDSDGDGIPDAVEAGLNPETPADTDNDGVADFLDTDSDGDGISDAIEAGPVGSTPLDTDGDGTPNFLDLDADNDGTPDATEAGSNPDTPVDSDGNGVPDFMESDLVDSDGDGISDEVEGTTDSDGDGIPDFQDTDSDNDGIPDSLEAGPTPSTPLDTDNDGIPDLLDIDSDNDGLLDQDETAIDNDRDGVADFRDLDSDNDGLTDAYEAGGTDTDANGIIDGFTDSNGDGWDDSVAAQPLPDNDFDGDGIVDHLDVDSDNDGLPDLAESNDFSADTDGNGRVDNFTDANNDGLDDSVAVFPLTADDVDNDGAPDHLDLDTDNDGVSDLLEAGGTDANGDNMVDAVLDTDGDGIPDVVDIDQTPGNDSDSDGIIDSADIDSNATAQDTDGDGIIDAADPDQDGDGFADFQADGTGSPNIDIIADNNNNGIPDIDEPISGATSDALIRTGVDGGCSIGGTDSRDPLLPLLALVSIAYLLRRRSLRIPALLSSILVGSVMIAPNNVAIAAEEPTSLSSRQAQDRADDRLRRQIYIGFGFGSSTLTPDTSELVDWDVSDDSDSGMQFTLGYDVNRWFSVEAHATELGDAGLSPMGSINYKTNGISALFYVGKARHRHKRHGLTAYGRIGLGGLVNTRSDDTVPYSQDNSNHLLFGLGAEYTGRRGLGVRAEFIQFDTDAQYTQLGLIYRFGKTKKRPRYSQQQITEQAPQAATQTLPEITPTPSTSIAADGDADGVSDNIDLCLDTSAGTAVDAKGCALFNGVLEGVNFESGSAALTTNARVILTEVAATLRAYPDMRFVLSAHTDDQGATKANQELSKQRVISVARFLRNAGIDVSRFSLKAYGELRPIADNTTAAGRAKNRRVEMKAIK